MAATNAPRVFSRNRGLLRSLLFGTPGCRVAAFGDSTWAGLGGPGNYDMAWMQYLWANHFGGVSGTELSYPDQTRALAVPGPVSDSHCMSDYNAGGVVAASLADSYLLPHRNSVNNGYKFKYSGFDGYGHFLLLNHAHDNARSAVGGDPAGSLDYYGYYQVNSYRYDVTPLLGSAAFAGGTMMHGRSLIDASSNGSTSKLKLEIHAACYAGSIDKLRYRICTQTAAEFYTKNIATPVEIVGPTLTTAGGTTLNAAAGTYRKFTSANLPLLTGTQRYYMAEINGNTELDADAAHIIGARYISDNLLGPIIDNHSQAGYATSNYGTAHSIITDHANCFPYFTAAGTQVAFICYGHNDDGNGATKAQYKANLSTLCTNLFTAGIQAIVLVSTSAKTGETAVKATYADAEYELAQADSRISTVNVREITQTDNGWTPSSNATWTSDGLHHNATGAEVFQKAFFNGVLALMSGGNSGLRKTRIIRNDGFQTTSGYGVRLGR